MPDSPLIEGDADLVCAVAKGCADMLCRRTDKILGSMGFGQEGIVLLLREIKFWPAMNPVAVNGEMIHQREMVRFCIGLEKFNIPGFVMAAGDKLSIGINMAQHSGITAVFFGVCVSIVI